MFLHLLSGILPVRSLRESEFANPFRALSRLIGGSGREMARQAGKYRIILKKKGSSPEAMGFPCIYIRIQFQYNMQYRPLSTARSSFRHTSFLLHFRASDVSHIDSRFDVRVCIHTQRTSRKEISFTKFFLECYRMRRTLFDETL